MASTRTFKFVDAPPERSMRKKSPESAPRLFEWLVNNGYVEPVTTYSKGGGRKKSAAIGGVGRVGVGKKKKKGKLSF